jgi:coenzyme F420 hydrogenase subunit beta
MLEIDDNTVEVGLLSCQELEENVWRRNMCAGCRGCIAVCPADALAYDPKLNRPSQVTLCVDCKACLDACPRLPGNTNRIASSEILGHYVDIKNVRSKTSSGRFQNGGAVTALLTAALEEDLVDYALVMGVDRWTQKAHPRAVYDANGLMECAGSRYTNNAVLEAIKESKAKNIALVGTPCAVQAIGLLRRSSNEYAMKLAQKVRFLIGLFCFEAFDDSLISEIGRRLGTPSWRIDKMSAAEGIMVVTLRDGVQRSIPLSELAGFVKPGCRSCNDFTSTLSDLSVGSIGSAPGMSAVIIRTPEGLGLFEIAEEMGLIESWDGVNIKAIERVGKTKLRKNGF